LGSTRAIGSWSYRYGCCTLTNPVPPQNAVRNRLRSLTFGGLWRAISIWRRAAQVATVRAFSEVTGLRWSVQRCELGLVFGALPVENAAAVSMPGALWAVVVELRR
jgi:hypothetical protein